jgi:hypothetical protein
MSRYGFKELFKLGQLPLWHYHAKPDDARDGGSNRAGLFHFQMRKVSYLIGESARLEQRNSWKLWYPLASEPTFHRGEALEIDIVRYCVNHQQFCERPDLLHFIVVLSLARARTLHKKGRPASSLREGSSVFPIMSYRGQLSAGASSPRVGRLIRLKSSLTQTESTQARPSANFFLWVVLVSFCYPVWQAVWR